jgi:hypothetical protein
MRRVDASVRQKKTGGYRISMWLTCESLSTLGELGVRMPATVPLPLARSA